MDPYETDLRERLGTIVARPVPAHPFEAVERRARQVRRRRRATAGGLATVALVAAALPLALRPSAPRSPDVAALARRFSAVPTGIVLGYGSVLDTLDAPPSTITTIAPQQLRQLPGGAFVGIAGADLVRWAPSRTHRIATADSYLLGLGPDEVWAVREGPHQPVVVQKYRVDGRQLTRAFRLPRGWEPYGEAPDGLVVETARGRTPEELAQLGEMEPKPRITRDILVVDPATGAVRRTLATNAAVADVVNGFVVRGFVEVCLDTSDCRYRVEDTRTGRSWPLPRTGGAGADPPRLSADGRWAAYAELDVEPGEPAPGWSSSAESTYRTVVVDVRTGAHRVVPGSRSRGHGPLAWSANRLLFVVRPYATTPADDDRAVLGVYLADAGTVHYGRRPGGFGVLSPPIGTGAVGALDMDPPW